jgi:hypothetical protein
MALLLHPFVSMLQPRAHELARVNEEESQGKSVRVNGEEQRTTPKISHMKGLYNYMKSRTTWPSSQEAHVTTFLN